MANGKMILRHLRLVDGSGAAAVEDAALVFSPGGAEHGGCIEYAGPAAALAEGTEGLTLDLEGYTVLPGLFNVHVHLDLELPYLNYYVDKFGDAYRTLVAYRRAAEALWCGVTTLRNVGGAGDFDIALRNAVNRGMLTAPRIVACGSGVAPHGGHGSTVPGVIQCSGKTEFIKAIRANISRGVDQIKLLYTGGIAGAEGLNDKQITDEELAVCLEVAHGAHKKVTAHLSYDEAIALSVRLGIDCVEHGYEMKGATARMMAERGVWLVPTLCVSNSRDFLKAHDSPDYVLDKLDKAAETHRRSIAGAITAGVPICAGTDLLPSDPLDGATAMVRELELLVDAGLSPPEAIKAATANSARLCDLEDRTGTLREGLAADLILVKGKPDKKIADLRNLVLVAKDGRVLRSELPEYPVDGWKEIAGAGELGGGSFIHW
ncbi:MAG: amidohydrolase family protein [Treponema sp.]|jgi:imidazolonepropionase-like amidohydrolase|nr:amidohydrolase family protein [Treponema sp.]